MKKWLFLVRLPMWHQDGSYKLQWLLNDLTVIHRVHSLEIMQFSRIWLFASNILNLKVNDTKVTVYLLDQL